MGKKIGALSKYMLIRLEVYPPIAMMPAWARENIPRYPFMILMPKTIIE
jgi:hypothetical protein